jgi:hypothetical protein
MKLVITADTKEDLIKACKLILLVSSNFQIFEKTDSHFTTGPTHITIYEQ